MSKNHIRDRVGIDFQILLKRSKSSLRFSSELSAIKTMYRFVYNRPRKEFGRQCLFSDDSKILIEDKPDYDLRGNFIRKDPLDSGVQNVSQRAAAETSTISTKYDSAGVNHVEGGWPKDLNTLDEEQTSRYKRRAERDPKYEHQMKRLTVQAEHIAHQNAAINIFQHYFDSDNVESASIGRGTNETRIDSIRFFVANKINAASASHLCFSPEVAEHLAVAYSLKSFPSTESGCPSCVWDINYSQEPLIYLNTASALAQVEFNRKDGFILAAGRMDGVVSIYDTRIGSDAQICSQMEHSHRDYVSDLLWILSKTGTEFFTGSKDGTVMWWDTRNMDAPCESYSLKSNDEQQHGCTALEFSFSMPSKFMVGTENGLIYSGNKRGTTFAERFVYHINSFNGPVVCLERNPSADKYVFALGDHLFKIWSDDCRENCVLSSDQYKEDLTSFAWNKNRAAMFFLGMSSGQIEVWDLLRSQIHPITAISKTASPALHISSHRNGSVVACGHENGVVNLLEVSDTIAPDAKLERGSIVKVFDRETDREKYFLSKARELALLSSGRTANDDEDSDAENEDVDEVDPEEIVSATENYFLDVLK